MQNENKNKKIIEWVILILPPLFLFSLGVILHTGWLEIIASTIGVLSCILNTKRNNICFFFYVVYAVIYGISALLNKQYGEMSLFFGLNLPLYIITIYKLYFKKKTGKNDMDANYIYSMNKVELILVICIIPVATVGYGFLLKYLDSRLPFLNACCTSVCAFATYFGSKKKKEQWLFWICYSIMSSYIWIYNYVVFHESGLIYLILCVICLALNIRGVISWYQAYDLQKKKERAS